MNRTSHYRTNSPPVVHETIGGETILVHLENGTYYDLNAAGGFVFESFVGTGTIEETIVAAGVRYGASSKSVEAEIEAFAATLLAEELLVAAHDSAPPPASPNGQPQAGDAEWASPTLNKHTDMQELLVLDPVHEVDDAGWPARA